MRVSIFDQHFRKLQTRLRLLSMETILLLAHVEADGSLPSPPAKRCTPPRSEQAIAGSNLFVGLAGESVQAAADSIAACPATKYFWRGGRGVCASRATPRRGGGGSACQAAQATMVVAPATSRWNRVLPGVAQRLGGRVDTHVTGIGDAGGKPAISRWYYRQRMEAVAAHERSGPGSCSLIPAARRRATAARARRRSNWSP